MNKKSLFLSAVIFLSLSISSLVSAGTIYQNFEPDNGIPINIWSRTLEGRASVVDRHDGVYLGQNAARYESGWNWNGLGINTTPQLVDFKQVNNDRFTFWTLAFPHVTCQVWGCDTAVDNNIGISFHDASKYANGGFDVWTVKKAKYKQWTKLDVLFSQLPPDFDLKHISQIQFINYWPGKYYLDDFHAVREDRVYQSFNQGNRSGTTDSDYGWRWNDADIVGLSKDGEPVYEGSHSWKMVLNGKWGGGGIASEQQNYFFNKETKSAEQSFWHNNFLPQNNDRLSLWVYALPENGMDNNINIQIYDHGAHSTDETKAQVWTKLAARYGQWTQLEVLFKDLPVDLNLEDIDKIQIQDYWAGTFYIDDIRATGPRLKISEAALKSLAKAMWDYVPGTDLNANFRLQESVDGPDGPWVTIYSGAQYEFQLSALTPRWLRVRWEENFKGKNSLPYASPWSLPIEYKPRPVFLNYQALTNGFLMWENISQTNSHELQQAFSPAGPWTTTFKGPHQPTDRSNAFVGYWYRLRAIKETNNQISDFTPWSRPQKYDPGKGFVKAVGTALRGQDGLGDELVLSGVNLGNAFLIEDWMTGYGQADSPPIPDDWTLRQVLTDRFDANHAELLYRQHQNAYLNDWDYDFLVESPFTMVRLPIYYRNLMDDNGNFLLDPSDPNLFYQIDRVVNAFSDRGIYVLIDLHGAPGSQNAEFHSGRKDFNKLFEPSPAGETYRNRTENLWREIAKHYQNNPWVLGYDLLNEPTGAPTPTVLADFYDRLYRAIREVDTNHLIVMEGIWDWDTLPNPTDYGWQNVSYQFHYYCPMIAEPQKPADPLPVMGKSCANYGSMASRLEYQKAFIDAKVAQSRQNLYKVPVMVGEFNAFDQKEVWEYYLQTFNAQKWSWAVWSLKDHASPSNWGLFNHAHYDLPLPRFRAIEADGSAGDSFSTLLAKVQRYATGEYHVANVTLQNILKKYAAYPLYQTAKPEIFSLSSRQILSPSTFIVKGRNFGVTQGKSTVTVNSLALTAIRWSDQEIAVYFPTGQTLGNKKVVVTTAQGTSNPADLIIIAPQATKEVLGMQPAPDGTFTILGQKMCDTPGRVEFFPSTCVDEPPGSAACNHGDAAITFWSENLIKGYVPPDYAPGSFGGAKIHCSYGGQLYPTMIPPNRPPVFNLILNRIIAEGRLLSFGISATDPDGDPLTYSVIGLPAGAKFNGQTFSWTPNYSQAGKYNVTFQVTDGTFKIQKAMTITVVDTPLPDLVVTVLNGPGSALAGSKIAVRNTIKNQGKAPSGNLISIVIYLSKDPVITTADRWIYSRTTTKLVPGSSNTLLSTVVIPSNVVAGTYYLGAIVDYNNAHLESNESNNSLLGNSIQINRN